MEKPPTRCPCCDVPLVPRVNPTNGGRFLACSAYASTGCKVNWSFSTGSWHGLPHRVARGSRRRGPAFSLRERTVSALVARTGCSREEATDLLDRDGLEAILALVA